MYWLGMFSFQYKCKLMFAEETFIRLANTRCTSYFLYNQLSFVCSVPCIWKINICMYLYLQNKCSVIPATYNTCTCISVSSDLPVYDQIPSTEIVIFLVKVDLAIGDVIILMPYMLSFFTIFKGKRGIVKPPFELPEFIKV